MKKLLFTTIAVFILFSCSKDDDTSSLEELVFYSYYNTINYPYLNSYPAKGSPKVSARCYFFKAEDIKTSILKENIIIEKSYPDYAKVHSEVVELLLKENKLKLSDNSIINSIEIETRNSVLTTSLWPYAYTFYYNDDFDFSKSSYNRISLKPGKYFVVAIIPDDGYNFYSDKYSGKFITVSSEMPNKERHINIVFPWDYHRKGYFDWIDATDE